MSRDNAQYSNAHPFRHQFESWPNLSDESGLRAHHKDGQLDASLFSRHMPGYCLPGGLSLQELLWHPERGQTRSATPHPNEQPRIVVHRRTTHHNL